MSIKKDDNENEDSFQYSVDLQYINLINKTLCIKTRLSFSSRYRKVIKNNKNF